MTCEYSTVWVDVIYLSGDCFMKRPTAMLMASWHYHYVGSSVLGRGGGEEEETGGGLVPADRFT